MVGAILRHQALQPLKRAASDVWWNYKGRAIRNPELPAGIRSVLFVCLGNICRSPFAEKIAARRAAEYGVPFLSFSSAGLNVKVEARPPAEASAAAAPYGIVLDSHVPQQLTRALLLDHDIVAVMDPDQRELLRSGHPDLEHKVYLLSLFESNVSGFDRFTVRDPYGKPLSAFETCYRRIDHAVTSLVTSAGLRAGARL